MTTLSATATCSARVGFTAGEWSEMPLACSTSVGITRYTDKHGIERGYCRHHRGVVLYRYPVAWSDRCVLCKRPVDENAIRVSHTENGPVIGELCWRCQEQGDES